jgi:energy-coupling factor transporter ATP-binding protein EcfA2
MAHRLECIEVWNFRSIKHYYFQLHDYTPLVGYNNAGKSNIIKAIKWLLRASSLGMECFYDFEQPVEMIGRIGGISNDLLSTLSDGQRTSLTPFIVDEVLTIKRVQYRPSDGVKAIKLLVMNPAAKNDDEYWKANPTGIDQALGVLFPEPIHIGAMENAEEDVSKSKSTSTIGKLLAEIISPIEREHGSKVKDALKGFRNLLNADGDDRAPELSVFEGQMNQMIDDFFPDVTVKLHIPTPELKEIFSKGTIRVYEGGEIGRDISSFGHGSQRAIQMALVRNLATLKKVDDKPRTRTLLLIDEPELYLHPQAIEVIRDALKKLSMDGYQVVFSTHSAMLLTHEDVGNAILVRKTAEHGTYCRQTVRSAIEHMEQDAKSQLRLLFSLTHASNILFCERVILIEGSTEERILPIVASKLIGKSLGMLKCALVKQSGGGSTRKSLLVLHVMDLPSKAVVDLDYAFKQGLADGLISSDDNDIAACKDILKQVAIDHGCVLNTDGLPTSGGGHKAAKVYSLLATYPDALPFISNLQTKLKANNIWLWSKGCIEDHLGIEGKSEDVWANFTLRFETEEPKDIIKDYSEVHACLNWLTS